MSGGHYGDFGRAYLETQHATGQICGKNRPILVRINPFSASASCRCGSRLARVDDGNMTGGQGDDVGSAYIETQQAMGRICGKNRPTLVQLMPFSGSARFRLPPPASTGFRQLPFRVSSGPCV